MQHIIFSKASKAFLKEYSVILILIPEVWTEKLKLFALHISYSTKLWFIHSFPIINKDYINVLARIRIRKLMRIRTGQRHAGSGSETLISTFFRMLDRFEGFTQPLPSKTNSDKSSAPTNSKSTLGNPSGSQEKNVHQPMDENEVTLKNCSIGIPCCC